MYMVQKSNSHYAPQPYTNQSVFESLLNCTSEISPSRNATGREFQRHLMVEYISHFQTMTSQLSRYLNDSETDRQTDRQTDRRNS